MGDEIYTCNAQIEATRLGFDRDVFATAWLTLKYDDGYCQGFGGSTLDDRAPIGENRKPTAWGMDYIFSIIRAVGVEKWEDVHGKYVRVKCRGLGLARKPFAIGHIIEDKWFNIEELAAKHGIGGGDHEGE